MLFTRRNKGKSKKLDRIAGEGTSKSPPKQANQGEAENEFASQTSSTLPLSEESRGREVPAGPPINTTDHDLKNAVQILTRIVAAQVQGQGGPTTSDDSAARVASRRTQDFLKLDPPTFTGSDPNEDPQDFIDQIQRALEVMHVFGVETVELAAYRLKGEAILWYEDWKRSRGIDALPASWEEFKMAFIDHYLPYEVREARADQFLNLRQGNMSVREYSL